MADTYEEPKSNVNSADLDLLKQIGKNTGFAIKEVVDQKEASGQVTPIQAERVKKVVDDSIEKTDIPKLQEMNIKL